MAKNNYSEKKVQKKPFLATINRQKALIFMSFPFLVWVIIFAYVPLWNWIIAFQNYKPSKGVFDQVWVGFDNFIKLFQDKTFVKALRNTLGMSTLGLIFGFTAPIIFALLLNEVKRLRFKRVIQTFSYLPHFVSWVITASIVTTMLSDHGPVNTLLMKVGLFSQPFPFMSDPKSFWFVVTFADVWKEVGWGAIIYLAAISGIDQQLYEAAAVDGAGRWRKMWNITLPSIMPTITVLAIMSIGGLLNIGFERQKLLGNSLVKDYSLVIDQYALEYGIGLMRYSYGTAIGMFKSLVSLILLFFVNSLARKYRDTSLF